MSFTCNIASFWGFLSASVQNKKVNFREFPENFNTGNSRGQTLIVIYYWPRTFCGWTKLFLANYFCMFLVYLLPHLSTATVWNIVAPFLFKCTGTWNKYFVQIIFVILVRSFVSLFCSQQFFCCPHLWPKTRIFLYVIEWVQNKISRLDKTTW